MALALTVVDSFTDRPFAGNPAAVAVVDAFPPDGRMQQVAAEMNLAETAFVAPRPDGHHDLRWFTPSVEVDLCGHATLAAAHVLAGSATFHTRSGVLSCTRVPSGLIEMDFPATPSTEAEPPPDLSIRGVKWFGRGRFDILIELGDAETVRNFEPDLVELAALGGRAVVITAPGDVDGVDCESRVFGPNVGIPEDPATGSAHCTLAVHWGERLGKTELVGHQASARGGTIHMRRRGDRVVLGGAAVTVATVEMVA